MELCDDVAGGVVRPERLTTNRRLILIALGLTAVRLLAAGLIPLTEDEAYYRLWAQHLQAGYLDHPPMIAWWIRAGMCVAGDTALGVRLLPSLATGLTTWLVGDLALRLGLCDRTAARAGLWYNATFTVALGGMLATPDTPACFFWTLCLWCLARAWTSRDGPWWLAAGAAAGLSCLSKYSGLFLAPGVFVWLLAAPGGLKELRRPWPWLAAVLAVAAFAPNVAWNAAHQWLTFDKQFGRVGAHHFRPGGLPEFLLTQFLVLNPLIAVQAWRGAVQAWRERGRAAERPGALLPIAVAAPFILYLAAHSLHDRVQGHWPVPAFSALVICAAAAAETGGGWLRRATPMVGLGLSAAMLAYLAAPLPGFGGSDPALYVRSWPAFAEQVEAVRRREGATWVGTESYGVAAQLDARRRIAAPIVQIVDRDRYFDWQKGADLSGPGLVLDLERRLTTAQLERCFAQVQPLGELQRGAVTSRWTRYSLFRVAGPKRDVLNQGCPWSD
jgi:4-amino-4-deoxy-L-arabinose transferase-like glycosyltransferase